MLSMDEEEQVVLVERLVEALERIATSLDQLVDEKKKEAKKSR